MIGEAQREITLNLHIKSVHIPVTEKTPLQVIWSRGNKKAQTKKRSLDEFVQTALIDEKFQINTVMDIDLETNKPTKPKISHLTIVSDKARGILGKCELNLSLYGDGEFNILKIPVQDCSSEEAYVEVGLKGVPAKKTSTPTSPSGGKTPSNYSNSDSLLVLLEDCERPKKEKNKLKVDYETKMAAQTEKINNL